MHYGPFYIPEWHHPIWGLSIFLVGCCLGSFFNVCIYRIPLDTSIVLPRSRCSSCGIGLKPYQNLPLIGWWLYRGWCACGLTRIDTRYFLVELVTGGMFVGLWFHYQPLLFIIYATFLSGLLVVSVIDMDHFIIPDRFSVGGILVGFAASTLFPYLHHEESAWMGFRASFLGATIGGLILYSISLIGRKIFKKDAMGLGDVKLLAAVGAFLGWESTIYIIGLSSMIGSVIGIFLMLKGPIGYGNRLPFGPFLSLAAAVWIFGGADWTAHYLDSLSALGLLPN